MKKTVLGIMAGAFLALSLASCGEKLLTPEQVQAEVSKGFDAGKAAVETEMNAKCDADFQARVDAEAAAMVAKAEADKAAAMPATASGKK